MKMLFALGGYISGTALGSPQFCSSSSHTPPSPHNMGAGAAAGHPTIYQSAQLCTGVASALFAFQQSQCGEE